MPPIPINQVSPYARRLLPARKVAERYQVHLGSVARWVARGVIPPPTTTINRRHYWDIDELDEADRARAKTAVKGRPVKSPRRVEVSGLPDEVT